MLSLLLPYAPSVCPPIGFANPRGAEPCRWVVWARWRWLWVWDRVWVRCRWRLPIRRVQRGRVGRVRLIPRRLRRRRRRGSPRRLGVRARAVVGPLTAVRLGPVPVRRSPRPAMAQARVGGSRARPISRRARRHRAVITPRVARSRRTPPSRMQRPPRRMPSPRSPASLRYRSPVRRWVPGPASGPVRCPRFRRPLRWWSRWWHRSRRRPLMLRRRRCR